MGTNLEGVPSGWCDDCGATEVDRRWWWAEDAGVQWCGGDVFEKEKLNKG
ncbi:hypothetical protein RchiOBHm_Chr4g0418971 [Rosa chinensis]|uniref:Uncharacterized protein n=1 Tax=Rosa chinensis TaxID=74649 RepID=A0A2P6QXJ6_ROSCH|nr:hypothetical protein RchiOBHm_Chr4g0418971 [Rosa chinensis]